MTIDEVRKKKKEFEQTILKMINTFEKETGTRIKEIDIERAYFVSGKSNAIDVVLDIRIGSAG